MLNELLGKLPKLSSIDTQIVLYDQYETRYGIYNHQQPNKMRPLASVALQPSENFTERSILYDALEEYALENYRDVWGLSVAEFLDLPQYLVKMLRSVMPTALERKRKALEDAEAAALSTKS